MDPTVAKELRDQGAFDQIYVETLSHSVTIVETLAKTCYSENAIEAAPIPGRGSFQRLADLNRLFTEYCNTPVRAGLPDDVWSGLVETWAKRHVLIHNHGFVDDGYLRSAPNTSLELGQRVTVSEQDALAALRLADILCGAIGSSNAGIKP